MDYLATMGTANAVESGLPGGYRMAINGDQTMVFAALMNYVGKTLKIPANQVALSKLIGDQIGMGYGDEIGAIVVAAQGGDALSIADASVALCESIAENLGIKSNKRRHRRFLCKGDGVLQPHRPRDRRSLQRLRQQGCSITRAIRKNDLETRFSLYVRNLLIFREIIIRKSAVPLHGGFSLFLQANQPSRRVH